MSKSERNYAVVVGGKVVNVAVWDGQTPWTPDTGDVVEIPADSYAGVGWDYVGGKFVDNRPVEDDEE
jgi:hypothetical protein